MKIAHITIRNFKNIDYAEYDLGDKNFFVGKNYIGKSNTILAIYWLLTGYMLDGTSNDISLKQNKNTRNIVSVEATFEDGWKFRKDYYEKWTTTKGVSAYSGNIIDYYINSIKCNNNDDAYNGLKAKLGIKEVDLMESGKKIDTIRAFTNPLYFTEQIEWKLLRSVIISLVGDANYDDIFSSNTELLKCKDILSINNFDDGKAKLMLNHEIKDLTFNNKALGISNATLSLDKPVAADELEIAENGIVEIDYEIQKAKPEKVKQDKIAKLNNLKEEIDKKYNSELSEYTNSVALENMKFQNELSSKKLELNKAESKLNEEYRAKNNSQQDSLDKIRAQIADCNKHISDQHTLSTMINLSKSKCEDLQKQIDDANAKLSYVNSDEWIEKNSNKCPNCGYILNKEATEKVRDNSREYYKNISADKRQELLKSKNELAELLSKVSNIDYNMLKKELDSKYDEISSSIDDSKVCDPIDTPEIIALKLNIENISNKISKGAENKFIPSKEYGDMKSKFIELRNEIDKDSDKAKEEFAIKKESLEKQKEKYIALRNQQVIYNKSQGDILSNNQKIDKNNKLIGGKNILIGLINDFTKARLNILDNNVKKVFGDQIKFKLLKQNINGGWESYCVPFIIGTDIEYQNGSTSEKLLTSFTIMEKIRAAFDEPKLPIIIDDCEKLDKDNIAAKLNSSCQLICAKVDDSSDKIKLIKE